MTRRALLGQTGAGLGLAALAGLLQDDGFGRDVGVQQGQQGALAPQGPHFPPRAKRVVVLWQGGGPSHVDLFDPKPGLEALRMTELPESVRRRARLSTMTSGQGSYPILPAIRPFQRYGESGMELSTLLPSIGGVADHLCLVRSLHTEAVNHAPGVTLWLTGSQLPGRPSLGAWAVYGLGSLSQDLPAFVVMTSSDQDRTCGQLFYDHYWGAGFLPSKHQGVRLRASGDPILYLADPPGLSRELRRGALDDLAALNQRHLDAFGDPEIATRMAQYELAFQMQASVPDLLDLSRESASTLAMYGPDVQREGSYARNCLMARRLLERGVRFVQLMHSGWDQHRNLMTQLEVQCRDTDQPSAALVADLAQRGLLDDTIVLWGGEFGRTSFVQGDISRLDGHGRDHLGSCFSMWLAGGGFRGGHVHGASDDFAYHPAEGALHVHDLQATLLHQLGFDHKRLTWRHQGRDFRLTDVHGEVARGLLA
ncbi:MAG: DUF1501 domain-containing protein [Planctomycetota bacterium]